MTTWVRVFVVRGAGGHDPADLNELAVGGYALVDGAEVVFDRVVTVDAADAATVVIETLDGRMLRPCP